MSGSLGRSEHMMGFEEILPETINPYSSWSQRVQIVWFVLLCANTFLIRWLLQTEDMQNARRQILEFLKEVKCVLESLVLVASAIKILRVLTKFKVLMDNQQE